VESSLPADRSFPRYLGRPLQTVERREANQRHQVHVVLERGESLARRLEYGLLLGGEIRQQVDEHVGDGDAAGRGEPAAARRDAQNLQPAGEEVNARQTGREHDAEQHRHYCTPENAFTLWHPIPGKVRRTPERRASRRRLRLRRPTGGSRQP
jgi:hypothetical protein